ncbi:hypothetical protein sscle_08g064990 [Sclerotinia sclerotiorum 1980 UF-70]|uniref:Heterokaryon incompatibility domain-containing protein n=1 Tax=Sclerotinia sclerotiorum (strain ATCC 18683 / 1980 / Ss-1) TaxID=665079 RepID=A0A1D9QA07_SCLS1|nr:hypothetical protein sscle_08g064990 [Sclerotinia sclerotiorum 1980 UF-70]
MTLCEYCSAIEFEMLRCPTTEELRYLNTKSEVPDCYPFKSFIHNRQAPKFSLGPHTRIRQSSSTCSFCSAICDVVPDQKENPIRDLDSFKCVASMKSFARIVPIEAEAWDSNRDLMYLYRISLSWYPIVDGEETDEPGIHKTTDAAPWYYIEDAFQTYNGEIYQESNNNESVNRNSTVFSGRIRPEIVDIKQPAQWLQECLDNHKDLTPIFRLIDVRESKIVEFYNANIASFEYAALSYVWGGTQRTLLLKSNQQALQRAGSLTGCVPNTIQDAMTFSQQLGIQYLWVDALCIIQDSDSDKAIQIGTMGTIYAHSKLTLIAASGKNAEAGLPGIQNPRRGKQTQIDISPADTRISMKLIRTLHPHNNGYSFSHQLEDSEWSWRGWTLQERALSRRSIIFTDQQLFWACRKCHRLEETYCETSLAHASFFRLQETEYFLDTSLRNFFVSNDVIDQTWYKFRRLVSDYTKRQLTKAGDAHDAFHAILEQVKQLTGDSFLWGIPTRRFELGLCWEPGSLRGVRRRKDLTTLETTSLKRKVSFPSWSWLGWHGAIDIRVEARYRDLGMNPEIVCYVLRNSPLRLLRVPGISSDVPGAQTTIHPSQAQRMSPNFIELQDIPTHCPELNIDKLNDTPDDQLIFFRTEVAQFQVSSELITTKHEALRNTPWEPEYTFYIRNISDMNGNVVAQMICNQEDEILGQKEPESHGGIFDFILLANNEPPDPESKPSKIVLQVKREDGIMYRVNNAEIPEEVWERMNARKILVALG